MGGNGVYNPGNLHVILQTFACRNICSTLLGNMGTGGDGQKSGGFSVFII